MSEWIFTYGVENSPLSDRSEARIPILYDSPYLIYEAIANLSNPQIGTFIHSEFLNELGWTVINRYPVYRGKNQLLISEGFVNHYRLSFVPSNTRSATVAFSLKIWTPAMPLSRAGSSSTLPVSSNGHTVVIPSTTNSVELLAANPARRGATILNNSTATLYFMFSDLVGPNSQAASLGDSAYSVDLRAGDYYEIPYGYVGPIEGKWSAQNGSAFVTEFV